MMVNECMANSTSWTTNETKTNTTAMPAKSNGRTATICPWPRLRET